jgi:uncharacterized protein
MVLRKDAQRRDAAVVTELKQWDATQPSDAEQCVSTLVGNGVRDVLHPSVQVGQYAQYSSDYHTAFTEERVGLAACAYPHDLQFDPDDELLAAKHRSALVRHPLFMGDGTNDLVAYRQGRLGFGSGLDAWNAVLRGATRAGKTTLIVRGGPGTGKSVVAFSGFDAQQATGSRSFTGNVRKIVGSRAANQFKYFNTYMSTGHDAIDVLVMDEAHRIRASSNNRFTPKSRRSEAMERGLDSR